MLVRGSKNLEVFPSEKAMERSIAKLGDSEESCNGVSRMTARDQVAGQRCGRLRDSRETCFVKLAWFWARIGLAVSVVSGCKSFEAQQCDLACIVTSCRLLSSPVSRFVSIASR